MYKIFTGRGKPFGLSYKQIGRFAMRVSCFYIVLLAGSVQLLMAHSGNSQALDELTLTLDIRNENLGSLLKKINEETGLTFSFPSDEVRKVRRITLPGEQHNVEEILNTVLEDTRLAWRQVDEKMVLIYIDTERETQQKKESIDNTPSAKGPTAYMVTGTVTDGSTQLALAGVNIVVKGTTRGTTTDVDGKFAIEAVASETLVFTFIGFKAFETQVGERTTIDVAMEADIQSLEAVEVRSTGYWTDTKERSTGNIAKVTAEEIERQPVTSPLMALQGRMAGVDVTPYNGVPGNAPKIRIRGENSLRFDGGDPLYIVDGVPFDSNPLASSGYLIETGFDPLRNLNPTNIESIEVLKDADATALYGSRGANGVILITTKKRKNLDEKTNLEISTYKGIGGIVNKIDLLNTQQYLAMRNEAFQNDGEQPDETNARDLILWDTTRFTDWQEVLLGGTSSITDLDVNISGGTKSTTYRLGGGFHKETMVFPGDFYYQRSSANFSLNHRSPNQKLRITLSFNYGSDKNRLFSDLNLVNYALSLAPNAPELYGENGDLNWEPAPDGTRTWENPLSLIRKGHDVSFKSLIANTSLSYQILPEISFKTNLGFTDLSGNELTKIPLSSLPPEYIGSSTAENTIGLNNRTTWIIEPQVTIHKSFGRHTLDVVVGTSFQESINEYLVIRGQGYSSDATLGSLKLASSTIIQEDERNQYKYAALFGRIGYNYDDRYLINLTGRRDGSSRFGPGNRFGNFGAIGLAWIFSNEKPLKGIGFLSFGKLRGSIGLTGNDQIGDYRFYDFYRKALYDYDGTIAIVPNSLFNPNFKWEETSKLEVAIELGFMKDRISLEASLYRNRSSNQLIQYQLPVTTGFSSIISNFNATVENKGLEVVMNSKNVTRNNFRWTTSFNFTFPSNKLVEFPDIENSSYSKTYKVGESLSIQRLYMWDGINPETGAYQFVDVDQDGGDPDDNDLVFMKPGDRTFYGGFNNILQYKRFEFSFLFQFSRHDARSLFVGQPGTLGNQPTYVLERWRQEGDLTNIQRFGQNSASNLSYSNATKSGYAFSDASFLRLKALTLSYLMPNEVISKARLQEVRMFLQGQNLLTFTSFTNLDPETGSSLPPLKVITIGAQIRL